MRKVVFVQGGGIGLDQEASVRRLFEAVGVPIEFEVHVAGRAALEQARDALPKETFDAVQACGVALKTKLLQPKGAGTPTAHGPTVPTNYNVAFRRGLGLFASVRPVHNLPGIPSRFIGVNFLLVREITEDLYTASEHEIVPGVVQSFKIVTESACLRFFRFAFELARKQGRKTVHCIHKANILKMADGLFLDCFRRIAAEFPDITPKELIVDNACMQLVSKPQQFEVLAAGKPLWRFALGSWGWVGWRRELHRSDEPRQRCDCLRSGLRRCARVCTTGHSQSAAIDSACHRIAEGPGRVERRRANSESSGRGAD